MKRSIIHILAGAAIASSLLITAWAQASPVTPADKAVLERITADSLKGHLSFIASDALEGRGTPSRGQEIAAEYIASQFRRAGLEPAGDSGYFQTANWVMTEGDPTSFSLSLSNGSESVRIPYTSVSFPSDAGLKLADAKVVKVDYKSADPLNGLTAELVGGAVVVLQLPDLRREDRSKMMEIARQLREFTAKLRALGPAIVVSFDAGAQPSGLGSRRLIDPEARPAGPGGPGMQGGGANLTITDRDAVRLFESLPVGVTAAKFSANIGPSIEKPVKLRNVIGILRGADPVLKDTYVLITAHYDHLGVVPGCTTGDCIYNGANDDGSGTVSVIELAGAIASRSVRPKRSIVFMTVFGEERGLLGSRYYGRHPIFPIEKTIADVNLEQVGRTDDNEGPMVAKASMTGYDFSDMGEIFKNAGLATGIDVFKHPRNSDAFFGRSDNQALADQGVPAHTICVAYEYPDYHGLGDQWEKIDYDNFAKVNRMVALGIMRIADNPDAPKWNEANPKTDRYVKAWKAKHP